MLRVTFVILFFSSILFYMFLLPVLPQSTRYRVTGPHSFENLSLFLIHGSDQRSVDPVPLHEAIAKGMVTVVESGNIFHVFVDNKSNRYVYAQAGSILKGGLQDRILITSSLLIPRTSHVLFFTYGVERGRWGQREKTSSMIFDSADFLAPSRSIKLLSYLRLVRPQHSTPQQRIYKLVKAIQFLLSNTLSILNEKTIEIASPISPTSLPLSLEYQSLILAKSQAYEKLFHIISGQDDVIGMAYSINGKLNSIEMYPTNKMFRSMWPKLLDAAIVESIAEKSSKRSDTTTPSLINDIINSRDLEPLITKYLTPYFVTTVFKKDDLLVTETRLSSILLNRSYISAK